MCSIEVTTWSAWWVTLFMTGCVGAGFLFVAGYNGLDSTHQSKPKFVSVTMMCTAVVLFLSLFIASVVFGVQNHWEYDETARVSCEQYGIEDKEREISQALMNGGMEEVDGVMVRRTSDGDTVLQQMNLLVSVHTVNEENVNPWKTNKQLEIEFYEKTVDNTWIRMNPL